MESYPTFAIGILGNDNLQGKFISLDGGNVDSPLLRNHYSGQAFYHLLYVNSLGYHEVYINGKKVDSSVCHLQFHNWISVRWL